jgi:dihydroorotase
VELPIGGLGVIGLETALPLTLELLVNRKVISLAKAISLLTWQPAKLFHLDRRGLGSLKPGTPADFVLLDPDAKVQVDRTFIQSKSYNTPFKGWTLPGKVLGTWVGGKRVWG